MALTGDHFVAHYKDHKIELVRNNWDKTLRLIIDGTEVAWERRLWPRTIRLTGTLTHNGTMHSVVADVVERFLSTDDKVTVDGQDLALTKIK